MDVALHLDLVLCHHERDHRGISTIEHTCLGLDVKVTTVLGPDGQPEVRALASCRLSFEDTTLHRGEQLHVTPFSDEVPIEDVRRRGIAVGGAISDAIDAMLRSRCPEWIAPNGMKRHPVHPGPLSVVHLLEERIDEGQISHHVAVISS